MSFSINTLTGRYRSLKLNQILACASILLSAVIFLSHARAYAHIHPRAQSLLDDQLFLESTLADAVDDDGPGFATVIMRRGEITAFAERGVEDLQSLEPIDRNTVFIIGSVSKHFTALATHILISRGKLELDDDIRVLIPDLAHLPGPITVGQLIHHTNGLRDIWPVFAINGITESDSLSRAYLRRLITGAQEVNFEPGKEYNYNNASYFILSEIIEKVSGQSFADFMYEELFEPLDMSSTYVAAEMADHPRSNARSYVRTSDGPWQLVPFGYIGNGPSGVWTCTKDMAKWLKNLANPIDQHRDAMSKMWIDGTLRTGQPVNYAAGFVVTALEGGEKLYRHTGHDQEFVSRLFINPKTGDGAFVVSNMSEQLSSVVKAVRGYVVGPLAQASREIPGFKSARLRPGIYETSAGFAVAFRKKEKGQWQARFGSGWLDIVPIKDGRVIEKGGEQIGYVRRDIKTGALVFIKADPYTSAVQADRYIRTGDVARTKLSERSLSGMFFSEELRSFIRIIPHKGGFAIENIRSTEPIPLEPLDGNRFQLSWGNEAYDEFFTLTAHEQKGRVDTIEFDNPYTSNQSFRRIEMMTAP